MTVNGNMHSSWRGRIKRYAPLILWIGFIFLFSSPVASFDKTSRIIGPLINFFFPNMPEATQSLIHGYVRKTAHFTEYAVLAFFATRAFSISKRAILRWWRYILPLALVVVTASLDELNQSYESSRTGAFADVLLDISGGAAMLLFLWLIKAPRGSD